MIKQIRKEELIKEDWSGVLMSLPLNKRQMTWASMLCNLGKAEDFIQIYKKSPSSEMAIMGYRRCLHNKGEVVVKEADLYGALKDDDDKKLHSLLQSLFLEIITQADYEYTIECIDGEYKNLQTIYSIHNENKDLKLRRVLMKLTLA